MNEHNKIGKILKETRESKKISLKEASQKTKISVSVLEILENGEYEKLPSYVHVIGFLKIYFKFLGINFDDLKERFEREYKGELYQEEEAKEALNEAIEKVKSVKKRKNSLWLVVIVLCVIGAAIFSFIYLKSNGIIEKFNQHNVKEEHIALDNESNNKTDFPVRQNENFEEVSDNADNVDNIDNYSVLSPIDLAKQLKEAEKTEKAELKSVTFEFSDTCWVHINIDGKHEMDFIAEAGSERIVEFSNFFELDVGNASALKIKYKDQILTGLGGWRQPVKKLYFNIDENGNLVFLKKK
jgi:cytoskeletal protein RodZ